MQNGSAGCLHAVMTDPCAGYLQVLTQQSQGRRSGMGPGYTSSSSSSVNRPCSRSARLAATAAFCFTQHHCTCRPSPLPTAVCLSNLPFLPSHLPLSLTRRYPSSLPPSLPCYPACLLSCIPRPDLTTEERELLVQELLGEVTALWQTDEIRRQKPTPVEGRCGEVGGPEEGPFGCGRCFNLFSMQQAGGGWLRLCQTGGTTSWCWFARLLQLRCVQSLHGQRQLELLDCNDRTGCTCTNTCACPCMHGSWMCLTTNCLAPPPAPAPAYMDLHFQRRAAGCMWWNRACGPLCPTSCAA